MSGHATKELIHKVNNLISVIYTQCEVGGSRESIEEARVAFGLIQRAAEATLPFVKDARAELERDGEAGPKA